MYGDGSFPGSTRHPLSKAGGHRGSSEGYKQGLPVNSLVKRDAAQQVLEATMVRPPGAP